jgi:hypothetical protein
MRLWLLSVGLALLVSCTDSTQGGGSQRTGADEVRAIRINPGLTPVSLFDDHLNDLIFRSFDMMTGTSMGVHVTVLANIQRLNVSAGDESEDKMFGPNTGDWTKSAFAAVPFTGGSSPKPNQQDDRTYFDLDIHAGVCWHDDVQLFQRFRGSHLIGTYAVVASIKQASDPNAYDDMDGAKTRATVYVLRKADEPTTGFAGVFAPVEFAFLSTAELPKASCRPADMSADYQRLVQGAEVPAAQTKGRSD